MVQSTEIVANATAGTLHQLILDEYERGIDEGDAAFVALTVELHNAGAIDLLAALSPTALADAQGFQFFTLQQFYCAAIPKIEAEPKPLMTVVSTLVKAAGNDMASYMPNAAYRDWCSLKPERPDLVMNLITAGDAEAMEYLSLTLEGGAVFDKRRFMEQAITYLRDAPELRQAALTALARIDSSGNVDLAHTALALMAEHVTEQADDMLRTHVLAATLGLYSRSPAEMHDEALALITQTIQHRGDGVLHHCASALFERKNLTDAMVELLITTLEDVNPAHLGTINSLDVALSELIKAGKGARVIGYLEKVFRAHPDALSFKQFDSVGHTLTREQQPLATDTTVRWLMSGDANLASHISDLMSASTQQPTIFTVDIAPYAFSDVEAIFLARKAIGWFFFHPITAASLIVCVLRTVNGDTAETIGDLLFDPLLLSYSGELRNYLQERTNDPSETAAPQIQQAIDKLDAYLNNLRAAGFIAELEPSERERLIERQKNTERMRQIQKQAEQSSVLLSLVSKSIILHGNGSIGYRYDMDGKPHRHSMKMGTYSSVWEAPRLEAIDPFGLDMQLRVFRAERLVA